MRGVISGYVPERANTKFGRDEMPRSTCKEYLRMTSNKKAIIIEMRKAGLRYSEIAKAVGMDEHNLRKRCIKWGVQYSDNETKANAAKALPIAEVNERIREKYPDFEYVSGYENNKSRILIRCLKCGSTHERAYIDLYNGGFHCPACLEKEREKQAKEREKENAKKRERARFNKSWRYAASKEVEVREQISMEICPMCGEIFIPIVVGKRQKYCSEKCRRRAQEHKYRSSKDAKRRSRIAVKCDNDITLESLWSRDNGQCWLCGERTLWDDATVDEQGTFIAGNLYPSIDHVVPLAKGGAHTWDNVKLAHRICNTRKSDRMINPRPR